MKHDECPSAGAGNIINKSVTDMDIDSDGAVEEKEHAHGVDAAGDVDVNVSGKPQAKIAKDTKTVAAATSFIALMQQIMAMAVTPTTLKSLSCKVLGQGPDETEYKYKFLSGAVIRSRTLFALESTTAV